MSAIYERRVYKWKCDNLWFWVVVVASFVFINFNVDVLDARKI